MMFLIACVLCAVAGYAQQGPLATTQYGVLEGVCESGVNVFKGVPFAAPPVGENRWRAPQPLQSWQGVRSAKKFGNDPMQGNPFGDMGFDAEKKSEDCLYLNIWTPSKTLTDRLPVVIYFNGGGLIAGSGSEPRYSGRQMARHGIVAVTANYREGIFGFFSHPQLSKETSYKGSGNYGFMDQAAAIKWVYENIAAFGGDPKQITIVGESAGSMSVSALLVSPLTRGMIARAMASSGAVCGRRLLSLKDAEKQGVEKLKELGLKNIADARKMSADELLAKTQSGGLASYCLDGYFFTEEFLQTKQNDYPLEFLHISQKNAPLFGNAPLAGFTPNADALRAECKHELLNRKLHLLREFSRIQAGITPMDFFIEFHEELLPILHGIAYLQSSVYPQNRVEIYQKFPAFEVQEPPLDYKQNVERADQFFAALDQLIQSL